VPGSTAEFTKRDRTCAELRDEGGLLADLPAQAIPEAYEQKISSTGMAELITPCLLNTKIRQDKGILLYKNLSRQANTMQNVLWKGE
jgi:hypothetical protein